MVRLLIIFCIALLTLIGFTGQAAYASGETYIVQPGDTLFTIAARYGISVNDLAAVNGLEGGLWVYAGQQLIIPAAMPFAEPPAFAGAPQQLPNPWASGFNPLPAPPAPTELYIVQPGDTLYGLANRYGVSLADLQAVNGPIDFTRPIYSGQHLVMPIRIIDPALSSSLIPPALAAPPHFAGPGWTQNNTPQNPWATYPAPAPNFYDSMPSTMAPAPFSTQPALPAARSTQPEKWIDVDLTRQTLTAFEGQRPVFGARVSTGIWQYPTVVGTFAVYVKYEAADMSGGAGDEAYYLPNVPYVMYFHGNYGLHGTYWHNNFGTPMSHGCVNLPTPDAEWLFHWAPLGTKVVTHY